MATNDAALNPPSAMEMSPQDRNESVNHTAPAAVEKHIPISPEDESCSTNNNNNEATVTPAFQMKDISTVPSSRHPQRRSPSPGVITSRRGRSRSPAASRPASRSSPPQQQLPPDGSISEAAIAAGEAAKRGPSPFTDYNHVVNGNGNHHLPRHTSPSRHEEQYRLESNNASVVNRWPDTDAGRSGSFECSPIHYNLSLGSFDWNNPVVEMMERNSSGSRQYRREYSPDRREPRENSGRTRYSPSPEVRYNPYYDEQQRRYSHDHLREEYRYYDDQRVRRPRYEPRYDSRYDRTYHHGDGTYGHSSRDDTAQGRSSSSSRQQQPLYSEHQLLSASHTYEERETTASVHRNANIYGRQSSTAFRDAPTPTADNSRGRGSVFRGVQDNDAYKSNVVTALKSAEEKEKVRVVTATTAAATKKRKGGGGNKGTDDKKRKRPKKSSKKESGKKKKTTEPLPEELLLDNDDDVDDEVVRGRNQKSTTATATARASPSPTNIDRELSAIGIEDCMMNLLGDGDYLSNLSFRKSYDLEQMFSFMKSPKSSMKETAGNAGGDMMDLKFGSMSFTNSFMMSASGEEKDGGEAIIVAPRGSSPKAELKMRPSHKRQPSNAVVPRQASRSSPLLGIPTIHTLTSQNSSLGLTPINSFSNDNGPIVPLTSHDGMALTAMFASSPVNVPPADHCEAAPPPRGMPMQHAQGPPPGYHEYSYRRDPRNPARSGPPPPSHVPGPIRTPPPLGPLPAPMASGLNKRIKIISLASPYQPSLDVTQRSDLYVLLKRLAPAFAGFQFKLSDTELPLHGDSRAYLPTENQLTVAQRRINSSICAFGGSVPRRTVSFESDADLTPTQKMEKEEKKAYENDISRYFMKEHCISWDVEVHDMIDPRDFKVAATKDDPTAPNYSAPVTPTTPSHHNLDKNTVLGVREKGKKVKYRCKLCGQPKQNHTCPYTSTVVRSIGTMVYTSVNAFESDEPGKLAPALSEMNNFTSLLSQDMSANTYRHYSNAFNLLTPDSHWSPNTPGAMSAISTPSTPGNQKRDHVLMSRTMSGVSAVGGVAAAAAADPDTLFRGTMELKPEQYRRVRFKADPKDDSYQYPHIPTPYSQRKEMGDGLFALSREVPKLADSCAAILRNARENDRWDQAVAELTTQVLIVLKCEEQDYTLEGLKRHLMTLGIAC